MKQGMVKKRSVKSGLPPGTLIHIGKRPDQAIKVSLLSYGGDHFVEKENCSLQDCFPLGPAAHVTWIDMEGIHQPEVLALVEEKLGIHLLVLEDVLNTDQRPKLEMFENYYFVALKMLSWKGKDGRFGEIIHEQVSLVVGNNFVMTFQEKEGDVFDSVRERIRKGSGLIRKEGPDFLTYSLLDAVVDNYFVILERLGEEIEDLEEKLLAGAGPETLRQIHHFKQEMIVLRKSVWPLREVIGGLERGEVRAVQPTTRVYLRDVHDHTVSVMDTIETFRELLAGMSDLYLTNINNRTNEVMKLLTIIATIFLPLTLIVGIYGMNFKTMPELDSPYGYPLTWAAMLFIGMFMLLYFRRKKWL